MLQHFNDVVVCHFGEGACLNQQRSYGEWGEGMGPEEYKQTCVKTGARGLYNAL